MSNNLPAVYEGALSPAEIKELEELQASGAALLEIPADMVRGKHFGKIPRLVLSQGNNPVPIDGVEDTTGHFVIKELEICFPRDKPLFVVGMRFEGVSYVAMPPYGKGDGLFYCASRDGITPNADRKDRYSDMQPGPCARCAWKEWGDEGGKPRCTEQFTTIICIVTDGAPIVCSLTARKTMMKPMATFNDHLKQASVSGRLVLIEPRREQRNVDGADRSWWMFKSALDPIKMPGKAQLAVVKLKQGVDSLYERGYRSEAEDLVDEHDINGQVVNDGQPPPDPQDETDIPF